MPHVTKSVVDKVGGGVCDQGQVHESKWNSKNRTGDNNVLKSKHDHIYGWPVDSYQNLNIIFLFININKGK